MLFHSNCLLSILFRRISVPSNSQLAMSTPDHPTALPTSSRMEDPDCIFVCSCCRRHFTIPQVLQECALCKRDCCSTCLDYIDIEICLDCISMRLETEPTDRGYKRDLVGFGSRAPAGMRIQIDSMLAQGLWTAYRHRRLRHTRFWFCSAQCLRHRAALLPLFL